MNTKLCYLYRDACNYKIYKEVIIKGQVGLNDIQPFLFEGCFFIPSEIGLTDLQGDVFNTYDHIWHEVVSADPTNEPFDADLDSAELINRFRSAYKNAWNECVVFKRKGLV